MYIAMNHFRIDPERGPDFEKVWRTFESMTMLTRRPVKRREPK